MSAARRWPGCCARPATASGYPSTSTAATARPSSGMPAQWGWKASSPSAAIGPTGLDGAPIGSGVHDMALQINDVVPDFEADTTQGRIHFHDWIGDSWAVL